MSVGLEKPARRRPSGAHSLVGRFVCLLAAALLWLAPSERAFAKGVTEQYRQANAEFLKGRYKKSARLLTKIMRKYPGFKPAPMLLGRIWYLNRQPRRAVQMFNRAGSTTLVPEAGFAWGASYLETQNYQRAIKGFKIVPKKSSEYLYAQFYLGVANYKLRRWSQAEIYLRKVPDRVLPSDLVAGKRRLLQDIAQKKAAERRGGGFASARQSPTTYFAAPPTPVTVYAPPPAYGAAPTPVAEADDAKKKEEEAKPAAPTTGFSTSATPYITVSKTDATSDNHGHKENRSSATVSKIGSNLRFAYDGKPVNGDQPNAGLLLNAYYYNTSEKETNIETFAYEGELDNPLANESTSASGKRSTEVSAQPFFSYPLAKGFSAAASYEIAQSLPDLASVESTGKRTALGSLTFNFLDNLTLAASGSMIEFYSDSKPLAATDTKFSGSLTGTADIFTLKGSVTQLATDTPAHDHDGGTGGYDSKLETALQASAAFGEITADATATLIDATPPPGKVVVGAQNVTKFGLSLSVPFSFGITATGTATFAQYENVVASVPTGEKDADGKDVTANALHSIDEQTAGGVIKVAPVDWVYVSVSYTLTSRVYSAKDENQQQPIEQNNADFTGKSVVELGLSKTF